MKKIITLVSLFIVLAVLGWFAFDLSRNDGVTDSEYIEFAVKDTNSVDKIIISDAFSNKFTLIRKGDEWTDEKGGCIMQSSAHYILEALGNISLKGYLAEKSHKKESNRSEVEGCIISLRSCQDSMQRGCCKS